MASRISFSFLESIMVGCLTGGLALQDCLELALEELDLLELLRGRSFSLRAFVLKKLNVLSMAIRTIILQQAGCYALLCISYNCIRKQDQQVGQMDEKCEGSEISENGHLHSFEGGALRLILPQHLYLPPLFLAVYVHADRLESAEVCVLGQFFSELLEGVGGEAEQALEPVVAVLLVLVDSQEAVVGGLEQPRQGLKRQCQVFLKLLEGVLLVRTVVQFNEGADEVVEHEPEVGEVGGLALLALESAPEEVVEQLIPLLVAGHCQLRRFHQFDDLQGDRLFDLALLFRLLLLFELHGQALLDAEAGLPVDLFELCPFGDLLALVEENPLALSKLLLEDELAGDEHLAGDDDAEEAALGVEEFSAFAHELVELQDLLLDAALQCVVLALPDAFMAEEVTVELLEEGEEGASQFEQPLVHPRPQHDIAAAEAHQPGLAHFLGLGAVSEAGFPQSFFVAAEEAIVDDEPDDLVLLREFALGGAEEEGPGLRFGRLLEEIVEFGELDQRYHLARLHFGHLVVEGDFLACGRGPLLAPALALVRGVLAHINFN